MKLLHQALLCGQDRKYPVNPGISRPPLWNLLFILPQAAKPPAALFLGVVLSRNYVKPGDDFKSHRMDWLLSTAFRKTKIMPLADKPHLHSG
jgi:hypothetical protein